MIMVLHVISLVALILTSSLSKRRVLQVLSPAVMRSLYGGDQKAVRSTIALLEQVDWPGAKKGILLRSADINYAWHLVNGSSRDNLVEIRSEVLLTNHRGKSVYPKTAGQARYIQAVKDNDVIFAIGPAGTGKDIPGSCYGCKSLQKQGCQQDRPCAPRSGGRRETGLFARGTSRKRLTPYLRPPL